LQYETEWDNAWALFESEFSQVELRARPREQAIDEVLVRFLESLIFATEQQLRDRSGFALRDVHASCARLLDEGRIAPAAVEGLDEVLITEPTLQRLEAGDREPVEPYEAVLHPLDPLVLAHRSELRRRYGRSGVLGYVVIDGAFAGAALGRWGILPFDVEDIVVEDPYAHGETRREGVLAGVELLYPPPTQRVLRFCGEPLAVER
jgi:hypothetical protein